MDYYGAPFQQNDLVWAKIQNYPWWPGKVIETLQQKKTKIFKVSFYADPTYCYLTQSALIAFQDFKQQLNLNLVDSQLQKAIILARKAFQRKNDPTDKRRLPKDKQTMIEDQFIYMQPQPLQRQSFEVQFQQESTIYYQQGRDNLNGKLTRINQNSQVLNLLIKYKLDRIPEIPAKIQQNTFQKHQHQPQLNESQPEEKAELFNPRKAQEKKFILKKLKKNQITKRRRVSSCTKEQKQINFMKRLCSLLIGKGFDSQQSRQTTLKIVERVNNTQTKFLNLQKEALKVDKIFVEILKIASWTDHNMTSEQKLHSVFKSAELAMDQCIDGGKEEQLKSRITQIQNNPDLVITGPSLMLI